MTKRRGRNEEEREYRRWLVRLWSDVEMGIAVRAALEAQRKAGR